MTGCPHSSRPGPCSQCWEHPSRKVEIRDGQVLVDGVPEDRAVEHDGATPRTRASRLRGGRRGR